MLLDITLFFGVFLVFVFGLNFTMDVINDINDIFEDILSDEDEDYINIVEQPRRNRIFHNRPNHMVLWNDKEFLHRFRISKASVEMILQRINGLLHRHTNRNHALSPQIQLLITLRFYATGSMIIVSADFGGIHESTASVVIRKVSEAIAGLRPIFVKLPQTPEEIMLVKNEFNQIARFPNVVAAIDCTHVKIQSPGGDNAELFRNRKGWFSLNVQTLSDARLRIIDIVARWPGSTSDRTIFANSRVKAAFEEGRFPNCYLLGDSGYTLSNYLMTPLLDPQIRPEQLYNESQIRTRNVVERQYGTWKRRFQVLRLEMRVKLNTVMAIIVATAVLHNIAIMNDDPLPEAEEYELDEVINDGFVIRNMPGEGERRNLIDNYFANLQDEE